VATIKFNYVNFDEPIGLLENLLLDCKKVRDSINNKSHEEGDPSSSVTDFYRQANEKIEVVQGRIDTLKAISRRILELNQNGVGTSNLNGDIVIENVSDVVESAGYSGFETWSRGILDAKMLVKYSENNPKPSAEELKALVGRMQLYQDDPSYAISMLSNIRPDQLLDIPTEMQELFPTRDYKGADVVIPSEYPDAGTSLVSVFAHLLAAGSTKWSDQKGEEYGKQLADACEERDRPDRIHVLNGILLTSKQEDINNDGERENIGLDYNDRMLTTLANRLENFNPEEESWGYWLTDWSEHAFASNYPSNPLSGVVHAMTGNPGASIKWLVPDGPQNDPLKDTKALERVQRIRSLVARDTLTDNTWTTDWAHIADRIDQGDGYTLGNKEYRGSSGWFKQSAQSIAVSGILNEIGMGDKDKGTPTFLSDSARVSVAKILGRHPGAVDDSAQQGNGDSPILETTDGNPPKTQWDPLFSDRALSNLIGQVSLNAKASADLGEAMRTYHQDELNKAVATKDKQIIIDAVDRQSQTNGFFAGAQGRTLVEVANNKDAHNRFSNSIVSYGVGLIPVAGGVAQLLMSHDDMTPFSVSNAQSAETSAQANLTEMKRLNSDQLTLQLLNSGVYSDEDVKAAKSRVTKDISAVELVVDENGKSKVEKISPEDLAKANSSDKNSRGAVGQGISRLGEELYGGGIDVRASSKQSFDDGANTAKPESGGAPADSWR
jgi:hypothetical protein